MRTDEQYLISLLENPVESDKTEYKSAIRFQEGEDFALKLTKHILGFANAGGGHIIIGFVENKVSGLLEIDNNLNDEVLSTFEVTRLSQFVNATLGSQDRIDLVINKIKFNEKTFPIIYVLPFKRRPYFCKKDCKLLNGTIALEEGAIYIRVPGAQTVKVAGAGDWDRLITQCIEAEFEVFLKRARDLLSTPIGDAHKKQDDASVLNRLKNARVRFNKKFMEL